MLNCSLIDTTLREGEQFLSAEFTLEQKIRIAQALDRFGVEYIELTSPAAWPGSEVHCRQICNLGLRARVLTHIRCHMGDARKVAGTGVAGVNIAVGTSPQMQRHSHGMTIEEIIDRARQVVPFLQDCGLEVRFSAEDSFRSRWEDLAKLFETLEAMRVDRVGLADTLGTATPGETSVLVHAVREVVSCGIEFHTHNDSGCAVANALCALEAGATHINTSILGIGERNGITSLGGLIARLYTVDRGLVAKYALGQLVALEDMVAAMVGLEVPFNNPITGHTAFAHKAGIHTNALLNDPRTYEGIDPSDFGLERKLHIAHRLTGWNAVAHRARLLKLRLNEEQIRGATARIKAMGADCPLSMDELDGILVGAARENMRAGDGHDTAPP